MPDARATRRRSRPAPRPLGKARLEELALAYVARFATSAGKLEGYLARKLRERGFDDDGAGSGAEAVSALIARFVDRGWVDDAGWGRMKADGLLARGYGARRIEQALRDGGLADDLRERLSPEDAARRQAAADYARRRRFGPWGGEVPQDPVGRSKRREKQLAAMLRAGHDFAAAAKVIDAATSEEVVEWVAQADAE